MSAMGLASTTVITQLDDLCAQQPDASASSSMAFGTGIHRCVGRHLAIQVAEAFLDELLLALQSHPAEIVCAEDESQTVIRSFTECILHFQN